MFKLLSIPALAIAFAATASATPTNFYLSGVLDDYFATVSGLIVIDPATGVVQPGNIFLSVEALPIYHLPAETVELSLQSVTSTHAVSLPGFGFGDGITTLSYADSAGTIVQIYISADNGSLVGYSGGICTGATDANCIASPLDGDRLDSFAAGPEAPGGVHVFDSASLTTTPEPSSLALSGSGLLAACAAARRRWLPPTPRS